MTTTDWTPFANSFELLDVDTPVAVFDVEYAMDNAILMQAIMNAVKSGLQLRSTRTSVWPIAPIEELEPEAAPMPKPAAKAKAAKPKPKPASNSKLYPNDSKVYLNWERLSTDEKLHLSQYRTIQGTVLSTTRQSYRSVDFDNNVMELTTRQLATTPGID